METLGDTGDTKNVPVFYCEKCDYGTSHKCDFDRHCHTKRHNVSSEETLGQKCPMTAYSCENCKKSYYSLSGLYKHKKVCETKPESATVTLMEFVQKQTEAFTKHMQSQKEDHDKTTGALQQQLSDTQKLMLEICKTLQVTAANSGVNNTQNNQHAVQNSHNNNKTFNLNFFLNETCKDALNLSDFIQNVKLDFDDIERIGNLGYVDGLSDVIMRNLNALGVEKRPIHCTDAKRNTIYIKEDNIWTKENEYLSRLQYLVDCMQKANLMVLAKWREKYPSCLLSNSMYTDSYLKMSHELMGGTCTGTNMAAKDSKIMRKIAKGVTINKSQN